MAPQVTELAYLPLKPGCNITDASTQEGKVWQDSLSTVLSQDGAQRAYWGLEIENPNVARLAIDWDTLDHHKAFIASPQYQPFVKDLLSIMDGGPRLYHAEFKPFPPSGGFGGNSAYPVTEVVTMYFAPDVSQDKVDKVPKDVETFLEEISISNRKHAAGWVVEEVDSDKVEGGKAKLFVGCIPWADVEEHKETTQTDAFKSAFQKLKDALNVKHMEVYHVKATTQQGEMSAEQRGAASVQQDAQEEILNPQAVGSGAPKTNSAGGTTKNN